MEKLRALLFTILSDYNGLKMYLMKLFISLRLFAIISRCEKRLIYFIVSIIAVKR